MHLSITSTFNHHPILLKQPNKMVVSCHRRQQQIAANTTDVGIQGLHNMLSLDSRDASVEDIKKAYRKLALQYHPDVCEPSRRDECTMVFLKLHDTYRTLLDKASGGENRTVRGEEREWNGEWEMQVMDLQRRSQSGMRQRGESWGSRMRAQHISS